MECRYAIVGFYTNKDKALLREVFGTFNELSIAIDFMDDMKKKYPKVSFRIKDFAERIKPIGNRENCTFDKNNFEYLWNKVSEIIDFINEEDDWNNIQ